MGRTKVYLLYTGGTFGMKPVVPGNPASPLAPASLEDLRECLGDIGAGQGIDWYLDQLRDERGDVVAPMDSSGVTPEHWITIAKALERVYSEYDGFVVIHGTDTLAYTATALSFLLVNLAKPVVVTGAQLPIFAERSDARLNLVNSLYIAGYKATGLPRVPEVTVCFGDRLLRGNRTRKLSTVAWQGFASPNYPPLGIIGESIRIQTQLVRNVPDEDAPFFVHRRLVDDVLDVTLYPGKKASTLAALLQGSEVRGLVLRAFGTGNSPGDPELLDIIGRAARSGVAVMIITQCLEGGVDLGRYESSMELLEQGVVSGFDLTPEAALVKLMWILALDPPSDEIPALLQQNHRGEQSVNRYFLSLPGKGTPDNPVRTAKLTARPAGRVSRRNLRRANLILRGLRFVEQMGGDLDLRVYMNSAGVEVGTPVDDVRCVGAFRGVYGELQSDRLILDITEGTKRLLVEDRPLMLVLANGEGLPFWFDRLDLDLLTDVEPPWL